MANVWANSMACHPRATCHIARCCHLANSVSWSQSYVSHFRFLPPGEFNGMSSQSHVSHCRVLPLGEFTLVIPEPHATLQGAVTWRNQCHDRATLQDVIISTAILKIVFRHIFFFKWSLGFDERRLSYGWRFWSFHFGGPLGWRHFHLGGGHTTGGGTQLILSCWTTGYIIICVKL